MHLLNQGGDKMARGFDEDMLNEIEDFITDYQKEYKKAPSTREVCRRFPNFFKNSYSKCQRYLHELEVQDRIPYTKGQGIDLMPVLLSGDTTKVSLVGRCPCGSPITAIENIEGTYDLPTELFGTEQHFMLRAVGSSMIECGIHSGDIMVVRQQNFAMPGQIVIALIGDEATAKIFLPQNDRVILRAANKAIRNGKPVYPDIVTKECMILGVVDNVIHRPVAKL